MEDIGTGWFVLVALAAVIVGFLWVFTGSSLGSPFLPPVTPVPS